MPPPFPFGEGNCLITAVRGYRLLACWLLVLFTSLRTLCYFKKYFVHCINRKLFFQISGAVQCFDSPINHNGNAVAIFCFIHVMRCYKYGNAFFSCFINQIPELAPRNRVNAAGWLVQENDLWLM